MKWIKNCEGHPSATGTGHRWIPVTKGQFTDDDDDNDDDNDDDDDDDNFVFVIVYSSVDNFWMLNCL